MNKTLTTFLLFFTSTILLAQKYTIKGTIKDIQGNPIPSTTIVFTKTKYGVSNFNGFYDVKSLKKGTYTVIVNSLGFKTIKKTLVVNKNTTQNFVLEEQSESLDNVSIKAKKSSTFQKEKAITISSLDIGDIATQTNIITDEIDKISGVRIRRSGSVGDNSNISINGLSGNAVRIYIDGVPLEFLYPRIDLANIPLTNLKRIDIYKGVLPADIGSDALGGGINLITENRTTNHLRASYSIGSFNTHNGDMNLTLANKNDYFVNVNGGIIYSDNDYTMLADLKIPNPFSLGTFVIVPDQNIRRFHDRYRMQYGGVSLGATNKNWTDFVKLTVNYFKTFKEYQNALIITDEAFNGVFRKGENISGVLNYKKSFLDNKLKLSTISNISKETTRFVDTLSIAHNWLGNIIREVDLPGEYNNGFPNLSDNITNSYVNRTSLTYNINNNHSVLTSNLIAHQTRKTINFKIDNPAISVTYPTQKLTKNISGIQYEGRYFNKKIEFNTALKNYNYTLKAIEFTSNQFIDKNDNFIGYNGGLKFNITDNFAIRGSYELGYLIPKIFQFAGNATGIVANAELKPEKSNNYNFGFQFKPNINEKYIVTLNFNGFIRQQKDIIFLNPDRKPLTYTNSEEVRAQGFENEISITFNNQVTLKNNFSYINKTFVSFDNLQGRLNDFLIGSRFPNTPSLFYNTELSWSPKNIFNTNIKGKMYVLHNYVENFNFRPVGVNETVTTSSENFVPNQNRFDAGISAKFINNKITANFNVVNIFNERLFDNFSIPRPGRTYNFKIIYEISDF